LDGLSGSFGAPQNSCLGRDAGDGGGAAVAFEVIEDSVDAGGAVEATLLSGCDQVG
jgi:hypothetical protein